MWPPSPTASRLRPAFVCCGLLLSCWITTSVGPAQLDHIRTAAQLLSQGQKEEAEHEAREAMADPTTRPLALSMLGTIRMEEGKYQEGTQFLKEALKLNPNLSGTWTTLGDAYVLQNKPDLAGESFEKALKANPSNDQARYDLAKLEASIHHYQKSLDVAQPIVPQLLKSDDGLLMLATDYGALKRKAELAGAVHAWQDLPAHSDQSSLEFGQILVSSGMPSEARAVAEDVESRSAGHISWTGAWKLGQIYVGLGDLDRADRNFELALSLNPACAPCDQGVAEVSDRQQNTEKALAYLIKAKQLQPEDPEILFEFGKICLKRDLIEDSLAALGKAVSLRPDDDRYIYVLGSANVARGNLTKAASLYNGLLQKHPKDPVLKYAVGTVYYLQGKYTEAESAFKQSLAEQPDQVGAAYYLSLTYTHFGRNDEAETLLRDLIKTHPQYAPSYVKLGAILVGKHQYTEAQVYLERAVALDSGSAQAHYQLYQVFRTLGKQSEAQQHYAEWQKLQASQAGKPHLELHLLLPD